MIKTEITQTGIRYIVYDNNDRIVVITSDRKLAQNLWEEARDAQR
jgi:rRNA-processing protein FCF1